MVEINGVLPQSEAVASHTKPSFWACHIFGWLGYVIIFTIDNLIFVGIYNKLGDLVVFPLFFSGLVVAMLTLPLRYVYQRCWGMSARQILLTILACSLFVAVLWTPIKNLLIWKWQGNFDLLSALAGNYDHPFSPLMLFMNVSSSFFMVMVWSSMYFGINYYFRYSAEQDSHFRAIRLSHIAQLKMLRYQINPHFLFNTLNAISTLVLKGNKDKANGMLSRLSTFLRFSLDNDPEKKIRLYEELKALMLYLEIEKTRFDERLSVQFNVEPRTEALLVPSLLLQPLVENSIKYAISKMAVNGVIEISASVSNNLLHLEVADNGPDAEIALHPSDGTGEQGVSSQGVGLRNIQDRLRVLYPGNYRFEIQRNSPQGLKVVIELPVEES